MNLSNRRVLKSNQRVGCFRLELCPRLFYAQSLVSLVHENIAPAAP